MLPKLFLSFLVYLSLAFPATAQICGGSLLGNLIPNGDFGSGTAQIQLSDPFLSPLYIYQTNPPWNDGTYVLAQNSSIGNTDLCWLSTSDNSSDPDGYFMMVNTGTASDILYQRTIEVCDGIDYVLRIDFINLLRNDCVGGILPNVDVLVDGQVALSTGNLPQDENWHTFESIISISAGSDLLTLSIRNNASGSVGNDIGIDNLSLQHCAPELILPAVTQTCEGGTSLSIDPTNITYPNPYFQWQQSFDGGNSWVDIPGAQGTTYFVSVPINGLQYRVQAANGPVNFQTPNCRTSSSPTVIELVTPQEVFQTPTICAGDTLHIGDQSLTTAGQYTVPIGGQSGCDTLLQVLLFTNPSYDQLYSQALCEGEAFLGQVFIADTLLQYTYQTAAGCDSIVNYEIDVLTQEEIVIDGAAIICNGESTTWTGPSGFTNYTWSTGSTASSISVSAAGSYELTVENSQGCSYTSSKNLSISDPIFELENVDTSCPDIADGSIEVIFQDGGVQPYFFSINEGQIQDNPLFEQLEAGQYSITMTDALGCNVVQTTDIADAPAATLSLQGIPSGPVEAGDTLFLSAQSPQAISFSWSGDGIPLCRNCAETLWIPLMGGQITLEAFTEKGCALSSDTVLTVLEPYRVYRPNAFSPNRDGQNDLFQLGLGSNAAEVEELAIYDRWGALIYEQNSALPPELAFWDGTKEGLAAPVGVYLYRAVVRFQNGKTKQLAGDVLLIR